MTLIVFSLASFVLVVDRLTKIAIVNNLQQGQSIKILPGVFHITFVLNNGMAFGLLKGWGAFFITLSMAVIVLIIVYTVRNKAMDVMLSVSLGLILGGATGNLIDRLLLSRVVDFLDFRIWPVFNIADSAITLGVGVLALRAILKSR